LRRNRSRGTLDLREHREAWIRHGNHRDVGLPAVRTRSRERREQRRLPAEGNAHETDVLHGREAISRRSMNYRRSATALAHGSLPILRLQSSEPGSCRVPGRLRRPVVRGGRSASAGGGGPARRSRHETEAGCAHGCVPSSRSFGNRPGPRREGGGAFCVAPPPFRVRTIRASSWSPRRSSRSRRPGRGAAVPARGPPTSSTHPRASSRSRTCREGQGASRGARA
jgi:hypothetical protein